MNNFIIETLDLKKTYKHSNGSIMLFDKSKKFEFIKSDLPPIGIMKYFAESMVKSNTINIKDKTFVVYTDGVTEGYLPNGEEFGAEGVENVVKEMESDLKRLEQIGSRFSKMGSDSELKSISLKELVDRQSAYLKKRLPLLKKEIELSVSVVYHK